MNENISECAHALISIWFEKLLLSLVFDQDVMVVAHLRFTLKWQTKISSFDQSSKDCYAIVFNDVVIYHARKKIKWIHHSSDGDLFTCTSLQQRSKDKKNSNKHEWTYIECDILHNNNFQKRFNFVPCICTFVPIFALRHEYDKVTIEEYSNLFVKEWKWFVFYICCIEGDTICVL